MAITYPLTMPDQRYESSGWVMANIVGVTESIYTFEQQVQAHQGQRLEVTVSLALMMRAAAAEWEAFFGKLLGRKGTFLLGDPLRNALLGAGGGTPVVDGASQTGQTLNVRGLAEASKVWLEGDWIQLGSGATARRYMVLNDVDGTGSPTGEAIVDIWPRLRESPADGATIVTVNTVGLFRLASNRVEFSVARSRAHAFTFAATEAL